MSLRRLKNSFVTNIGIALPAVEVANRVAITIMHDPQHSAANTIVMIELFIDIGLVINMVT